jgi:hypothetical protein
MILSFKQQEHACHHHTTTSTAHDELNSTGACRHARLEDVQHRWLADNPSTPGDSSNKPMLKLSHHCTPCHANQQELGMQLLPGVYHWHRFKQGCTTAKEGGP